MVQDGIAILKVGPALTYGLREALFAMSMMEKELVPAEEQAHFIETLEKVMLENPSNWQKHYHGDEQQLALARKYSFSDRARYYIGLPEVVDSMNKLFDNLNVHKIPMNMLHQYLPLSYDKVRDGIISLDPRELALDGVANFMKDYEYAVTL
jgi:D-tagatose-1,6-bisphosphate aldolase subunit GatZ/KbaZ